MGDDLSSKFNDPKVLASQLGDSAIPLSSLAVTAQRLSEGNPDSQHANDKKKRRAFMDIIDAANDYIEQLRKDIDDMENRFYEQDGDAWREEMALRVFGDDDVPPRNEHENIEAYRERLETILIAKMLNEDGTIKPQYSEGTELNIYAQWAQKKYNFNVANGYVQELKDPNTPPERTEEIYDELKRNPNIEKLTQVDRELAKESDVQGRVKDVADNVEDSSVRSMSIDTASKFTS